VQSGISFGIISAPDKKKHPENGLGIAFFEMFLLVRVLITDLSKKEKQQ